MPSYYLSDTTAATGVHVATNELEAATGTATAGDVTISEATTTATLGFVWTTPSGEPGTTIWNTGNYTAVLDATVNDGNFSYAVGTIGGVAGHFARVDSGLTADQTTHEMVETDFTGTGLKSASTGSVSFGTAAASDRFEIAVVYQRADSHGTKSLTLQLNELDDEVTGQWVIQTLQTLAATAVGVAAIAGVKRVLQTLAATVVGVATTARTLIKTLAAIATGVAADRKAPTLSLLSNTAMGTQNSYHGPYSIGGAFYAPLSDTGLNSVVMMKTTEATPGDGDWASIGDSIGLLSTQGTILSYWTFEHGSDLYVGVLQTGGRMSFHLFDPGTDTFTVSDETILEYGDDAEYQSANDFGISLAVRSDGDVVVGLRGNNLSDTKAMAIVRTSGTWGSLIDLDNTGTAETMVLVGPDSADRIYCFFRGSSNILNGIALLSGDTTGTQFTVDLGPNTSDILAGRGVIADGEYWLPYVDADDAISVAHDTFADSPGLSTIITGVSDVAVFGNGASSAPFAGDNMSLAAEGATIHLVYSRDSDQDVYHDEDVEGATADAELEDAVTAQRVNCNIV